MSRRPRPDEPGPETAPAPPAAETARPAPPPALADVLERTTIVTLPLATRFRGVLEREVAIVEGPVAWTEFSPFLEYGDVEASAWLAGALEFGFDASLDRIHTGWVGVNATVPAVEASRVAEVLARFGECRTAKVKVAEPGQSLADDVARVARVRELMGPDVAIRVDANGGWTADEAVRALEALAPLGLQYAEQPCRTVDELARVRERLRGAVRIAADESVRKASDPLAVARAGAADGVVVKAQPLGGVRRAAAVVREAGLPATVSSALDSSVGIAMGAQLAAAVAGDAERFGAPAGGFDAGLGTVSLFEADVAVSPLRPVDGRISLAPVEVDRAALRSLAAPRDRDAWWRERIARCHALLAASTASASIE